MTHPSRRNTNLLNMIGETLGTWHVVARDGTQGGATWRCRCVQCGVERVIPGQRLRRETPGCRECGAAHVPRSRVENVIQEPVTVIPRPSVTITARCRGCQHLALFAGNMCGVCGMAGGADLLEHVDGRVA